MLFPLLLLLLTTATLRRGQALCCVLVDGVFPLERMCPPVNLSPTGTHYLQEPNKNKQTNKQTKNKFIDHKVLAIIMN